MRDTRMTENKKKNTKSGTGRKMTASRAGSSAGRKTDAVRAGSTKAANGPERAAEMQEEPAKVAFPKPGNFLYPAPPVMVSCGLPGEKPNIITVAWAGTVCSDPPMVSISVRKERYSYEILKKTREFVINLPDRSMAHACDFCGCTTGAKTDKYAETRLTPGRSTQISAPTIEEAPVSIECVVKKILPLGSHDMFLAEVKAVQADSRYMDDRGSFHMEKADLIAYSHGRYYALGKMLGSFGYSVRKKKTEKGGRRRRTQ